ncbi:hypothetical protein GCM10009106_03360 [Sphingomonas japonica]
MAAALGATALTGVALAQQNPAPVPQTMTPPPAGKMARLDPNGDGVQTRAEAIAQADRMFQRLDADGNGQITAAEREAMHDKRAERREARGKPAGKHGGMRTRMLARIDANKDGQISLDEHRAMATLRFDRVDANRDGRIDTAERAEKREQRMARRGDMAPPPEAFDQ